MDFVPSPCTRLFRFLSLFRSLEETAILGFSITNLVFRHKLCPASDRSPRPSVGSVWTALKIVIIAEERSIEIAP